MADEKWELCYYVQGDLSSMHSSVLASACCC